MKIYFAGPLFTEYERSFISQCAVKLRENGMEVFVPHEMPWEDDPTDTRTRARRCLDKDCDGIFAANAILALVNGAEVDDGTACEIGIFSQLMLKDPTKKGIVALHGDWRTRPGGEGKPLNLFVHGCVLKSGAVVNTLDEAIARLKGWQAELDAAAEVKA